MATLVSDSNPIREEAAGTIYAMPATPLQSMLWGLADGGSADPSWNVAVRFRLSGPLDREVLEASLQRLTDRHEALRTGLAVDEGRVVQRFSARTTLSVEWCDLRGLDDAQQQEATRLSNEHARQRLPLDAAPMWRVRLLRLSSSEHWMLWNLSHAICDGWSVGLLAKNLMREYGDRMAGSETSREDTLDYGDYAVWLEAERQTSAYEAHRRYWNDRLRYVRTAAPPVHWSNRDDVAALPVLQSRLLPRELTDRLAAMAQRFDSTFFHAVLAAFALQIRTQQDSPELTLGTPVSGRDQPELEKVVGTFVNYVPLQLRVEADWPYREVLRAVREAVSESLDHASYRFEDILVDLGRPGTPLPARELFPSIFICQQDFVHSETSAGLTLTAMPSVSAGALRPLTVFMVERADGWRLSCEVDNRVVSAEAGAKLLEDLEKVMEAAAANPERAVPLLAQQTQCLKGHQNDLDGLAETRSSGEKAQPPGIPDAGEIDGAGESALKRVRATEVQHRFWLLDELNPGNASFDLSIRLEMRGPLDPDAFKSAANLLIQRNEILRTTFEEEDGQLWQIIHPDGVLDFEYVESEVSPAASNEPVGDVSKRFSLQKGPLFRIRLFRIGSETHRLSIDLSHAIADGWSSGLFLDQLRGAYLDLLSGSHAEPRALPLQFSSYAADERELLTNSETERRIDWWAQHLDGSWPPLSLPKDVDKTAGHSGYSAAVSCTAIAPSAIISARRFARESNSTLFAVFGAALQSLLARYSGQENILFITPFANRAGDRETVLGPVAMPICLTGRLDSGTTFRDLVGRLSTQSLEAVEHILPFSQVASLLNANVNADDGHHVLNQIAFFYQRAFVDEMQWGSLHVVPLPEFHAATGVEWQLGVVERKRGFSAEFLYSPAQYSEGTMSLVGAHYTRLLTAALANPDVPVSQLNILTPDELAAKAKNLPLLPVTQKLLNPSSTAEISELAAAVSPAEPAEAPISTADSGAALSGSEREMVRLWQPLFRNEHIGLNSNFFDLGGHSLLMARLQIALKKEFDVQLAVADVFRYPTVQELAAWLDRTRTTGKRSSSAVSNPRIIPIQPHGSATPIFVISQSMIFRGLAAALGEDQPLYALQMLDEDITPEMATADFEKLTEFYIQLIRQVQPQGPYRLAGWCVSGWIGYGIARQLEHEGEEIELLMIMDAWAPGYWIKRSFARRTLMRTVYRFQRLRWVGRRLLKASREERSLYIRRSLHGTAAAAARNIAVWLHRMDLPVQVRLTEEMRPSEQLEYTATRTFETGSLEGEVLIFRSEEQSRGPLLAEDMGWSELIGRAITVEQLPGDHQEIFNQAGAQMMARAARRILRDSPAEVGSGRSGNAVPSPA